MRHPAVSFAWQEFGDLRRAPSIAQVTGQIGLSSRRFIDVFNDQVGLTPKLFCRVRRFQKVLRRIGMGFPVSARRLTRRIEPST